MTPLAGLIAPGREDWQVIAILCAAVVVAVTIGGAFAWLFDWLDARRSPTHLTRAQLIERGAPPWPFVDWNEVYPTAAEGESLMPSASPEGRP